MGGWPNPRMKAIRIRSGSSKPVSRAICWRETPVVSTLWRAASRRNFSTNRAGVVPVSAWNTRAKLRGLIAAFSASASTETSVAGIDLALALVEDDLGEDVTRRAARELVVHQRRHGGQSQFSVLQDIRLASGRFDELIGWLRTNLTADF